MNNITFHRIITFLTALVGSFGTMLGVFIWTMLLHEQDINYEYLQYAAMRIGIISLVSAGVMAVIFNKRKIFSFIGGAVLGLVLGALFITLTS